VRDAARIYPLFQRGITSIVIMDAFTGYMSTRQLNELPFSGNPVATVPRPGKRACRRAGIGVCPNRACAAASRERLTTYEAAMWRIGLLLAMTLLAACGHAGYTEYSSRGVPFAKGDAECNYAAPKNVDISLYAQCMRLSGY
jgi:hypothetical protein